MAYVSGEWAVTIALKYIFIRIYHYMQKLKHPQTLRLTMRDVRWLSAELLLMLHCCQQAAITRIPIQ